MMDLFFYEIVIAFYIINFGLYDHGHVIMNILKIVLKTIAKIIHFVPATELQKIEYAKKYAHTNNSPFNTTTINPATGLPMIGAFDVAGNSFGSNSLPDDWYLRQQRDDRYRASLSYSSAQHNSYKHYNY